MTDAERIAAALERVAEVSDLTERVYARLFANHPDMEALFVRDANGGVKAEMLAKVWEILLDVADRREWAGRMIQCEVVTHEGYGVPPEVFGVFFETAVATVRDLDAAWTREDQAAFDRLLATVGHLARNPDQATTPIFA